MEYPKEKIFSGALHLPPIERAQLMEALFLSFQNHDRSEIDTAWAREAENRIDAYDNGTITSRPVSEILNEINEY